MNKLYYSYPDLTYQLTKLLYQEGQTLAMHLSAQEICSILAKDLSDKSEPPTSISKTAIVNGVSIDSRTTVPGDIFFALPGERSNGHCFVEDAIKKGAIFAVIDSVEAHRVPLHSHHSTLQVSSPLAALQTLASWYRQHTLEEVLVITGSQGKTIVKDTLKRILSDRAIISSPGSYNGQLGLPLSILSGDGSATIGIFEVGVSKPGEMAILEDIVRPNYGILTNIGTSHIAAFGDRQKICEEKLQLFHHIPNDGWVLLPSNETLLNNKLTTIAGSCVYVGSQLQLTNKKQTHQGTSFQLKMGDILSREITLISTSPHIIEDIHIAATAAHLLGKTIDDIADAIDGYTPNTTRMEIWTSPNGIKVINDNYSADPISIGAALQTQALQSKHNHGKQVFVFGGVADLNNDAHHFYQHVGIIAATNHVSHLITVGDDPLFTATSNAFLNHSPEATVKHIASVDLLKEELLVLLKHGDSILYKGLKAGGMTNAAQKLIGSISQRCMSIDLSAIRENIAQIRRLNGGARVMAVLKALSYGTELDKIAYQAKQLGIDAIGVSSVSEGASLRQSGVEQDIFVFLADTNDIEDIINHRLTTILYSSTMIDNFCQHLSNINQHDSKKNINVHLKIDTGMHRLGVKPNDVLMLAEKISQNDNIHLTGLCTHLASADDSQQDDFTLKQLSLFEQIKEKLIKAGYNSLDCHALNSAGAIRFPEHHHNMIRLGLSLYGIYTSAELKNNIDLSLAIAVTSKIVDIQTLETNESVGYSQSFTASKAMRLACIPFGYEDGMPWSLTGAASKKGIINAYVLIAGQRANIVGRISMDQMLIDITQLDNINIGDEVLIYGTKDGHELRPEYIAEQSNIIPHELLIRLGKRVQRIFIESS